MEYQNHDYLNSLMQDLSTPEVWKKWINAFLEGVEILPAQSTAEINVPEKILRKKDILEAQEAILA